VVKATKKKALYNKKTIEVVAWFAPEIPYNYGPLGYYGLPGLILELQGYDFIIYAEEVKFNKKSPNIKTATLPRRYANSSNAIWPKTASFFWRWSVLTDKFSSSMIEAFIRILAKFEQKELIVAFDIAQGIGIYPLDHVLIISRSTLYPIDEMVGIPFGERLHAGGRDDTLRSWIALLGHVPSPAKDE